MLTHDTGELAPVLSGVLLSALVASRIRRLELEHMKKCKIHSMKMKATPNIKTSAVTVAFCKEFMKFWTFFWLCGTVSSNNT